MVLAHHPSLLHCALLQGLSAKARATLQQHLRVISYGPGDLIFQEGGPSAGFYIVLEGLVQYGKYSGRRTRRRILKLLGPGECFGEEMLFQTEICTCPGYARALTQSVVGFIERSVFLDFLNAHPEAWPKICEYVTRQLRIFECKLVELAYEPVEQNLIRLLVILMDRFGVQGREGVVLEVPLSRQELADLLGVHLDTVIHELSKLRERGLIALSTHKIVIKEPKRLREIAEPQTTCLSEHLF
ncbi:MAG: Crp/Fnr family transcriptional regulator [Candidatus Bipolaricaulota bacterium]|nr:Crp/Fnr family transcriptional regulator [Candidatus Bipolaricaulota bacterium]MDW8030334.1 Crp/Fnr family transcriptional regulator [Candidatus Bipolaricaulota bacterium]